MSMKKKEKKKNKHACLCMGREIKRRPQPQSMRLRGAQAADRDDTTDQGRRRAKAMSPRSTVPARAESSTHQHDTCQMKPNELPSPTAADPIHVLCNSVILRILQVRYELTGSDTIPRPAARYGRCLIVYD
jgi:hypothetical protein